MASGGPEIGSKQNCRLAPVWGGMGRQGNRGADACPRGAGGSVAASLGRRSGRKGGTLVEPAGRGLRRCVRIGTGLARSLVRAPCCAGVGLGWESGGSVRGQGHSDGFCELFAKTGSTALLPQVPLDRHRLVLTTRRSTWSASWAIADLGLGACSMLRARLPRPVLGLGESGSKILTGSSNGRGKRR